MKSRVSWKGQLRDFLTSTRETRDVKWEWSFGAVCSLVDRGSTHTMGTLDQHRDELLCEC